MSLFTPHLKSAIYLESVKIGKINKNGVTVTKYNKTNCTQFLKKVTTCYPGEPPSALSLSLLIPFSLD